jgi:hypothetical protein
MLLALVPLLESALVPRVDNPWPERIGLGFPFAMAGAVGVLASLAAGDDDREARDRAIYRGGLWGFRFGAALYVVALMFQVASGR